MVGAGIAGLSAAWHLARRGVEVTVVEAAGRVGGRMISDDLAGYHIDCGAQFLSSAYPILRELIIDLGLAADCVPTSPWTAVRRGGVIYRLRYDDVFSPLKSGLLSRAEWFKLGWNSLRLARDLRNLPVNDYAAWARFDTQAASAWYPAQYGGWMNEYLIEPMLEGFYFQSPEETSRALPMAVSAFLLRGAKTMTLRGGIGTLTSALARGLRVCLDEAVEKICIEENEVRVYSNRGERRVGRVILAVPAAAAKRIYGQAGPLEAVLLDTPYAATLNLTLGLAQNWPLPKALQEVYGLLLPRQERCCIAAVAFETAKCADRAASGQLLNVMLSGSAGATMQTWEEAQVLQALLPELEGILPGLSRQIIFSKLYRWPLAEPKSPVGRSRNIAAYRENGSRQCRVLLAGDYLGMPFTEGAAETGRWAAEQILRTGSG